MLSQSDSVGSKQPQGCIQSGRKVTYWPLSGDRVEEDSAKARRDLGIAIIGFLLFTSYLGHFDAFGSLQELAREYEEWKLETVLLALLASPAFLGWIAARRWHDASMEIRLRHQREQELIEMQGLLRHRVAHDILTDLPNRQLLTDRLQQAMAQAGRSSQGIAIVYIDLDGFKTINDTHGHETGDQVLVTEATRMKQVLREGDTIARMGGDEFVAVLLNIADAKACVPMLTRLLSTIRQPLPVGNSVHRISASIGVTLYPQKKELDANQLLSQADRAMYRAKLSGKNCYHIFDKGHVAAGDLSACASHMKRI